MVVLIPILSLLSLADAMPGYKDHGNSLETRQDTSLNCGNWATGSRASAQALQKQLLACDDNLWGKSFTVAGTADVKSGSPSPCIGLACDYVSTTDFHHTQFQLCNVRTFFFLSIFCKENQGVLYILRRCAYNARPS